MSFSSLSNIYSTDVYLKVDVRTATPTTNVKYPTAEMTIVGGLRRICAGSMSLFSPLFLLY